MVARSRFTGVVMGLFLILLTGVAWGGIGIVLDFASKRKLSALTFITVATGISSVAAWAFLAKWPVLLAGEVERPAHLTLLLTVGGIAGAVGMLCLQKSMTAGAAAWTVGQSAMVIPFLVGILFLGDDMRVCGGLGVAVIMCSLASFYKEDRNSESSGQPWLRFALIAFVFLGVQQTLSSIPSSWDGWSDTAELRVPIVLTAGAIPLACVIAYRRQSIGRGIWGLALCYATLVVVGQALLFRAMDQLRTEGRLSLAFPLALGTCIVIVSLWDLFVNRRPASRFTLVGIVLGLVGVILLAC
jgi:uncharacterized membrane protein